MKSIRWPILATIVVVFLILLRFYVISSQPVKLRSGEFDCMDLECTYVIKLENTGNKPEVGKVGIYGKINRRGFQLKSGTSAGVYFEEYEIQAFSSIELNGTKVFNEPPGYLMFHIVNQW